MMAKPLGAIKFGFIVPGEGRPSRAAALRGPEGGGVARLLLIEDDADTAADVLADLRGRGHAVEWAATGTEGATMAEAGGWGAIIFDRMLRGATVSPCCATSAPGATGPRPWCSAP